MLNCLLLKTIESIANEKVKKLNGKIKKGRIKIHICETCHGNGYVRVAKLDGDPSVDFRDRSEVHQCWDCDSEGEYYETITMVLSMMVILTACTKQV